LSAVPIENLYYLIAYALDVAPAEMRRGVDRVTATRPADLFADLLCTQASALLRRGLERHYVEVADEIPGLRGKLDVTRTACRMLESQGRTACRFTVLSYDTPMNRLLRHTLESLARADLDDDRRRRCIRLAARFHRAAPCTRAEALGATLRWHRNNRAYRFAIGLCRLICEDALPTDRDGALTFPAYDLDSRELGTLFERFVRNFWRREQTWWRVRGNARLRWPAVGSDPDVRLLPSQETDIDLYDAHGRWIVECKCTRSPLAGRFGARRLHGSYVNQLYAYLENARAAGATLHGGLLLHAAIDEPFTADLHLHGHRFVVRTVDLGTHWHEIAEQLSEIAVGLRAPVDSPVDAIA